MTIRLSPGVPAKTKYKAIKYSHISTKPGQSSVLTADPWSYLYGHLLKCKKGRKSKNKQNLERAIYFANLAEDFYKAGLNTELPVQGTLLYYSMLNLVKCYLSKNGVALEQKIEHHGLLVEPSNKFELVVKPASKDHINIFAEFSKLLGKPVAARATVKLQDAIVHIPELHTICHNLGFLRKQKFLGININFLTNKNHTYLFTEVNYDKANDALLRTDKFLNEERRKYFKEGYPMEGYSVYRSVAAKKITGGNYDVIYKNILKEYSKLSIASILTRSGYYYYADLAPGSYHHLCYTFMVMFYIGTAARYRPSEVKEALEGNLRPLVTEAVALCPKQFMNQLVSLIVEEPCVIPYSQI